MVVKRPISLTRSQPHRISYRTTTHKNTREIHQQYQFIALQKKRKMHPLIFQSIFKIQGTTGKIIESVISQRKNYKINLLKQNLRPEVKHHIVEDYENHNLVMQLIHDQPVA